MSRPKRWRERLLDLFFPPKCVFCRRLLGSGEQSVCSLCPQTLPRRARTSAPGPFCDACAVPLRYEGVVRESVLRFKFHGMKGYADVYGSLVAESVRELPETSFDFVTWVPVSKKRERQRGYDQARLLAAAVARELDLPLCAALEKTVHTPAQSGISDPARRRANILGVYQPLGDLTRCRVLLVDDVITTGATCSECARVLRQAGAAYIACAALAATEKDKTKD